MSHFTTLLWKEWRDHRVTLLGYVIGVPPLIAWGMSALPAAKRVEPMLASWAALCGLVIAMLTIFGDLFAGEEQRGTIKLLRRMPGGLLPAFLAKVAFALLGALVMSGVGYVTTVGLGVAVWGAKAWPALMLPAFGQPEWLFALAGWVAVAAIWLPRATVALPAAALTIVLFGAPMAMAFWMQPGMQPTTGELQAALIGLSLAALLVAGLSFVLGKRRAARSWKPAAIGLLATLGCFAPAYAWTGVRVARFLELDPSAANFRLDRRLDAALSPDGRQAYVVGYHVAKETTAVRAVTDRESARGDGPPHALAVDLVDGTSRALGPAGSKFWSPSICDSHGMRTPTPRLAVIAPTGPTGFSRATKDKSVRFEVIDTVLGDVVREGILDDDVLAPLLADRERWPDCSLPLPDGRRWRAENGRLVVDPGRELPDGQINLAHLWFRLEPRGFGCSVDQGANGYGEYYDLLREKRYSRRTDYVVRWIGRSSWVVWRVQQAGNSLVGRYARLDPDTQELTPIPGFGVRDDVLDLEVGGLFLVDRRGTFVPGTAPNDAPRWLEWLDVDSGEATPIEPVAAIDLRQTWIRVVGRLPSGRLVVRLERQGFWVRFARAIPTGHGARLELTPDLESAELLGSADEESLVVIDAGRRLVRVRFDTSPPELLFPR